MRGVNPNFAKQNLHMKRCEPPQLFPASNKLHVNEDIRLEMAFKDTENYQIEQGLMPLNA